MANKRLAKAVTIKKAAQKLISKQLKMAFQCFVDLDAGATMQTKSPKNQRIF